MRFLLAVLSLGGTELALAHTPEASWMNSLFHQFTSMHHLPALTIVAVLATLLVLLLRRSRATR